MLKNIFIDRFLGYYVFILFLFGMNEMLEFFEYVVMLVSWDVLDVLLFSRFIIFGFCKILVYLEYIYNVENFII